MYYPKLSQARVVRRYQAGDRFALLLTDCESSQTIQYIHALFVYRTSDFPCFAVACESSRQVPESRLLGVFPGDGHQNLGHDLKWGDLDQFASKAIALAAERLGSAQPFVKVPVKQEVVVRPTPEPGKDQAKCDAFFEASLSCLAHQGDLSPASHQVFTDMKTAKLASQKESPAPQQSPPPQASAAPQLSPAAYQSPAARQSAAAPQQSPAASPQTDLLTRPKPWWQFWK